MFRGVIVLNQVPDIPITSQNNFSDETELEYGEDDIDFEFEDDKTGSD